jgi:SAM-dependent methyltransferase
LRHFAELRPDLRLLSADIAGVPRAYPKGTQFHRADLECDRLPWADASMDAITCMHLVEHLRELTLLFSEIARLLKPGGRVYVETPHPRTLDVPNTAGSRAVSFTLNFHDDPTHIRVVDPAALEAGFRGNGLEISGGGTSCNWLFVAAWPFYAFRAPSRKKYTAYAHWLGWSAWTAARRPA